MRTFSLLSIILLTVCASCSSEDNANESPSLIVKFKFDPNQERLNNLGQPSNVQNGNAAQTPLFEKISAHYFELSPLPTTLLGQGEVLYHAPETNAGGVTAIDFSKAIVVGENETFLKIPLKNITPGSYNWVRVSLAYQRYGIQLLAQGNELMGTLESFVGYNTYIKTHRIHQQTFEVNANRRQGYWAFALSQFNFGSSGLAPEGATTVPNPLFNTSPIPAGSCVVTGDFPAPLVITGNETKNIVVTLSLSINQSFEWTEVVPDGKFEPGIGEQVIDMGLRGLKPSYQISGN